MTSHRALIGAVTAALAALVGLSSPTSGGAAAAEHPPHTGVNAVTAWNEFSVATLAALPAPAGGAPPASAVNVAMVQGAVYDAVNAIGPKHFRSYLLRDRFPACASRDAAAGTAAHAVLHYIVATAPGIDADRATRLAAVDAQYDTFMAGIPASWCTSKGVEAGEAAAAAMMSARVGDGRFGPSPWVPNDDPGHWMPLTDPTTGAQILDPTPWVGNVKPFLLRSSSQFRTDGPNDLTSARWARDYNEVKALGAVNSTMRSADQTYVAKWWQSNPVVSWNDVARQLVTRYGLGTLVTARLLALQDLSSADASINCWNDKYFWDFWRPWNAIPRGEEDGNPATVADPSWKPLISAPYPEHPSGHLCIDGANTTVLRRTFGDWPHGGFDITSASALLAPAPADPRLRSFRGFPQVLSEIVNARIWAGLHFRTADLQGRALGQTVARYGARHYFEPVRH